MAYREQINRMPRMSYPKRHSGLDSLAIFNEIAEFFVSDILWSWIRNILIMFFIYLTFGVQGKGVHVADTGNSPNVMPVKEIEWEW